MSSNSKPLLVLKTLAAFVKLARDPNALEQVFVITDGLRGTARMKAMIAAIKKDAQNAALINERYQAPMADLDELHKLPAGSLGHEFARHMKANNLSVAFYPNVDIVDDITYVEMRARATHDIWHVVTGFGVDVPGELGLQSFMLAQNLSVLAPVLFAVGFVRYAIMGEVQGQPLSRIMDEISYGWQLGQKMRPLFAQRWETGWARPLADWRSELGLEVAHSQIAA